MEQLNEAFERLGGITPAVGEEFNPLSVEDIAQIRERFAHGLPEAIVKILSNYGAVSFIEYVYCRPRTSNERFLVSTFFGKYSKQYPKASAISLLNQLDTHREDFDRNFLPFADSGGGDVFGVDLLSGNVMYWSHDNPNIEFTYLSKSFDDWLSTLET